MENLPILCCSACYPAQTAVPIKPHNDPNRKIHFLIQVSFLNFCVRRLASHPLPTPSMLPVPQDLIPKPVLTPEALANNPIKKDSPYIIHLQARVNFGPVVAHRYFLCPLDLRNEWTEISQVHFFAEGYPFGLKAMKWGISCDEHVMFYHLSLRPNLKMRFHPDDVGSKYSLVSKRQWNGEEESDYYPETLEAVQYTVYDQHAEGQQHMALDQQPGYQNQHGLDPGINFNTLQTPLCIEEYHQALSCHSDDPQVYTAFNPIFPIDRGPFSQQLDKCRQLMPYQVEATQDYHLPIDKEFAAMDQCESRPELVVYQPATPSLEIELKPPVKSNGENLASVLEKQLCVRY